MQVTVIGASGGMPRPGNPSSGYLVRTRSTVVLLDCGPGVATALGAHMDPEELGAVVITHMHVDHCHDLLVLGKQLVSATSGDARVLLLVPTGATATLRRHAALYPIGADGDHDPRMDRVFDDVYDVREYQPGDQVDIEKASLHLVAMRHRLPTCGVRVLEDGQAVAYTGDTGMTDAVVDLARGVDVLLCESTLAEPETGTNPHGHLSADQAGVLAARAQVARLVLTHLTADGAPRADALRRAAAAAFSGPIDVAVPGMTVNA